MSAAVAALARVMPGGGGQSMRLVERNLLVFRKNGGWLVILSGFIEPLLYLAGMGFGVGALIGRVGGVRYAVFVAPALMASSAMNGAVNETTFNMFYKLRYLKLYDTVLATPLRILDVAVGEVTWALMRSASYAVCFVIVMAALGLIVSPWAALAAPAALLISIAFAGAGVMTTTLMRTWQDFAAVQVALLPMFLFSGTFYPLSTYPPALQVVVQLTPLYHGVHMLRSFTTGDVTAAVLLDVLYLAAMGTACVLLAVRRLDRLLLR
ncbi:MAG TPA: ABC transporter permease [Candidatus Dormibacteraeota bacterium]|nr:ABC transporter permease [Candidatus Dormibacteraeota bacterium]